MNYLASILILIIYFPIILLSLIPSFKEKFCKVHSKKYSEYFVEILIGIIYFAIIILALIKPFHKFAYFGIILYSVSLLIVYIGYIQFLLNKSLIVTGVYSISRNPTYFFGFIAILGIAFATNCFLIIILVILQFFLTHKIILKEEKYCIKTYKNKYAKYSKEVSRYIWI